MSFELPNRPSDPPRIGPLNRISNFESKNSAPVTNTGKSYQFARAMFQDACRSAPCTCGTFRVPSRDLHLLPLADKARRALRNRSRSRSGAPGSIPTLEAIPDRTAASHWTASPCEAPPRRGARANQGAPAVSRGTAFQCRSAVPPGHRPHCRPLVPRVPGVQELRQRRALPGRATSAARQASSGRARSGSEAGLAEALARWRLCWAASAMVRIWSAGARPERENSGSGVPLRSGACLCRVRHRPNAGRDQAGAR